VFCFALGLMFAEFRGRFAPPPLNTPLELQHFGCSLDSQFCSQQSATRVHGLQCKLVMTRPRHKLKGLLYCITTSDSHFVTVSYFT